MVEALVVVLIPLVVAALVIRYEQHPTVIHATRFTDAVLASRSLPAVCGLVSALIMAWVWSGSDFIPTIADEFAYLLQAEIFAKGAWSLDARPMPEFFEQVHTFVTPFVASKYYPGQSLLLVPGILAGFQPLVPLLLIFGSGLLIVALGRRVTNGWVAFLAWAIWTTTRSNLRFLPSYFSEVTTVFLWLLGWWALYDWHRRPRRRTLIILSLCIAWALITRPVAGLVFAIPAITVGVWSARRHGLLAEIRYSLMVGAAVMCIVPLWSKGTTGQWTQTPHSLYTKTYLPWDNMGFGLDSTPPIRALAASQTWEMDGFMALHQKHSVESLPYNAGVRLRALHRDVFTTWRAGLVVFFLLGLLSLSPVVAVGGIAAILLFAVHLSYAHPPAWTVYYLEALPVVAMVTVLGFARVVALLRRKIQPGGEGGGSLFGLALAIALIAGSLPTVGSELARRNDHAGFRLRLWHVIASLPTPRNLVFLRVKQAPPALVTNDADLAGARASLVYDRGSENVRLQELVPDRAAYLIDIDAGTLTALAPVKNRSR